VRLIQVVQTPELRLEVKAGQEQLDRVVKGAYASDLLSNVMARANEGNIWITLQAHQKYCGSGCFIELSRDRYCGWD